MDGWMDGWENWIQACIDRFISSFARTACARLRARIYVDQCACACVCARVHACTCRRTRACLFRAVFRGVCGCVSLYVSTAARVPFEACTRIGRSASHLVQGGRVGDKPIPKALIRHPASLRVSKKGVPVAGDLVVHEVANEPRYK